jgi:adenine-specific DNA-methyltransferase
MNLTDRDKEIIKQHLDRNEPLPAKYKLMLFADAPEVELVWQGKSSEVTSAVLPFQSIEQIDEPRQKAMEQIASLFGADSRGRQSSGWTNKLIWGNNNLVLSSLKNGPLRKQIEDAGGLKLIYIDPPFDVGADFSVDIEVGDETLTKEPSVIEELAYRDTWGRGTDSYLAMFFERAVLMRDLLADGGSIFVHCDWHVGHYVKVVLDEIFGSSRFLNEIVWYYYNKFQGNVDRFASNHDTIFWYSRSNEFTFNRIREKRDSKVKQLKRVWDKKKGAIVNAKGEDGKVLYIETDERTIDDVWRLSMLQPADKTENLGYDTQKPASILERVLAATTNEGDLIADFFCGSGTTLAVAEKLGRKWIGCDLGRFGIHTTRKRLIGVQRELKAEGKPYRSFEILNLGKYERQYFLNQMAGDGGDQTQRAQLAVQKEEQYLHLILSAYKAQRVLQMPPFHGKKGANAIVVGPIDAPVTLALVHEVLAACRKQKISKVDVLGFEFEMGLTPAVQDEAKAGGINLSLKYIPKDVFDKRAVERGQVQFYDVAYVEVLPKVDKLKATVTLKDFGVFYHQDDLSTLGEKLKPGGSKVTIEGGQVVKIAKDKKTEKVTREVLTRKWSDWIDYWSVDFHFEDKKEIVRVVEDGPAGAKVEREIWTGNYIFENEWQSFRTRKDRTLELTSAVHSYPARGKYKIAVKVIDIFGNDTTKVVEVKV